MFLKRERKSRHYSLVEKSRSKGFELLTSGFSIFEMKKKSQIINCSIFTGNWIKYLFIITSLYEKNY